jgi:elongation factor 1 alpha-like protein
MCADACREVEKATAAEASSGAAGRRGLHLVVMGHVDAGKSTLMGRLLHDLGQVSQKEVHKNQRESAQAGKVGTGAWGIGTVDRSCCACGSFEVDCLHCPCCSSC